MMYMRNFPEKRDPFFWNILACELAGSEIDSSDTGQKVLRPLAYRFLSRAILDAETASRSVGFCRVMLGRA